MEPENQNPTPTEEKPVPEEKSNYNLPDKPVPEKKGIMQRWWFWAILFVLVTMMISTIGCGALGYYVYTKTDGDWQSFTLDDVFDSYDYEYDDYVYDDYNYNVNSGISQTFYTVNQSLVLGELQWNVSKVAELGTVLKAEDSLFPTVMDDLIAYDGYRFIRLEMEVTNLGASSLSVGSPAILDTSGYSYDTLTEYYAWIPEDRENFIYLTFEPGKTSYLSTVYEVPVGATGLTAEIENPNWDSQDTAIVNLGI